MLNYSTPETVAVDVAGDVLDDLRISPHHQAVGRDRFPHALTPLRIGPVTLPTRVGLGPINTSLFTPDGDLPDAHLGFYDQYASQPLGVIYAGAIAVSPEGRSNAGSLLLDRPANARGLGRIARRCHQAGVAFAVQLMHAGRQVHPAEIGQPIVAPSALPCPVVGAVPRALTAREIGGVCRKFGKAAAIAQRAGADLVEIHGAHGYLVGGFLSPVSNTRTDAYRAVPGQPSRFLTELLETIRDKTSLPVGLRVSVVENTHGGLGLTELAQTLAPLRDRLAFVSVSAGVYAPAGDLIIPSRALGGMLWREHAATLRHQLGIPVLVTGNFHGMDEVEAVVASRDADAVLMVRALLADPALVTKQLAGPQATVQPCTDCKLCKYHSRGEPHVYCPFNPELIAVRRAWLRTSRDRRIPLASDVTANQNASHDPIAAPQPPPGRRHAVGHRDPHPGQPRPAHHQGLRT